MTESSSTATTARPGLPSPEQVAELGFPVHRVAPPEWEDGNGHVNVVSHYRFHMELATIYFTEALGLGEQYVRDHQLSTFSMEQHLSFYDEVLVGHEVSGYLRLLDVGPKLVHAMSVVVDDTTGRIANTVEIVEAHVDLATRRATPWRPEIADRLERTLAQHQALTWTLPRNTGMGLRRKDAR